MKAQKMPGPNTGIKCHVNTCYYYMQGDHCTAAQIEVQPRDASTAEQTDCATFTKQ